MWKSAKTAALEQHMDTTAPGRQAAELYGNIPSTSEAVRKACVG